MAIVFYCNAASELLPRIKRAIDSGRVVTWSYDKDGDFTHVSQWKNKAWLRPQVFDDRLRFVIVAPKGTRLTREIYAVYHGRFIEMMLAHFDTLVERAVATSLPAAGDLVGST